MFTTLYGLELYQVVFTSAWNWSSEDYDLHEAMRWCALNIGRQGKDWFLLKQNDSLDYLFFFKQEEDATAFTLAMK